MKRKFLPAKCYNKGHQNETFEEQALESVKFKIHKNNKKKRPSNPKDIVFICCFSEFGCEILGDLYCIPSIVRSNPTKYFVVVGWYGREYLYRHLVDEFWEIGEEFMHLREYSLAFHHASKNLKKIEDQLGQFGTVVGSSVLGSMVVTAECRKCKEKWANVKKDLFCPKCNSPDVVPSLFGDAKQRKSLAYPIPRPSREKQEYVKQWLGANPVGIFARGRKRYGRNLPPEFYERLIKQLRDRGYDPIWLGEKQSTIPCPVADVVDFSRMPEARDLELTLAIISQLKFTVQFWTASSRLAAILGVPYIIVESPDQLWGVGQEGYRLNLCSMGPKKIAISHFRSFIENQDEGLKIVDRCVEELVAGNEEIVFGLLQDEAAVRQQMEDNKERIGS